MRPLTLVAVALCIPFAVSADPMGSVQGPGNVRLDIEDPQISLDREVLSFDVECDYVRITADLEFHNHGDACEVGMSFPMLMWHPGSGQDFVKSFGARLGQQALTVTEGEEGPKILLQGHERHCSWYHFTVPFEANVTQRLTCWYIQRGLERVQVPYVLATGGTWKGTISDFTLRVNLGERRNFSDIELSGDNEPLPYEEADDTLTWTCADYNGQPELLWFRATRGPAQVTIDGAAPTGYHDVRTGELSFYSYERPFAWHAGRLLVSRRAMQSITLASGDQGQGMTRFTRGDRSAETDAVGLPAQTSEKLHVTRHETYVDPEPICAVFGGSVQHSFTPEGDLTVAVTSAPDDADTAAEVALNQGANFANRLRCLRRLAERWPGVFPGVAREICERDTENLHVLLFLLGHLADDPPGYATAEAILPRLHVPGDKGWVANIFRNTLRTNDDDIARGLGLILAARDPIEARDHIVSLAAEGERWQNTQARNLALALRVARPPDMAAGLVAVIDQPEKPKNAGEVMAVLGYLGDEAALPFLTEVVYGKPEWENQKARTAAVAIARIGTPDALGRLVELAADPRHDFVRGSCLYGLHVALGDPSLRGYSPPSFPDWAQPTSPSDAAAVIKPLLPRLREALPEDCAEGLTTIERLVDDLIE